MLPRLRPVAAAPAVLLALLLTPVAGTPVARAGVEERTVTIRAAEPREDVFLVRGRVRPAYPERRAVVQRKLRRAAHWSRWRTVTTTARGRYRQRVRALQRPGVVCYRVRVPGDSGFAVAFSDRVCLRTFWT